MRDFVWHLYWYFEPSYRTANELGATAAIPRWFAELDGAYINRSGPVAPVRLR